MSDNSILLDDSQFLIATDNSTDNVGKKLGKKVVNYIPSVLVGIPLFSISTLSSLYRLNFAWEKVDWGKLAITVVIQMVMVFCAKWIGADLKYQKMLGSTFVKTAKKAFFDLQEGIDLADFDEWIARQNRARKISAYTTMQRRSIDKMRKVVSWYNHLDEITQKGAEKRETKRKKLLAKIKMAEDALDPDYIAANIDHLKVRYGVMLTADFMSPCESTSEAERYRMSESVEHGKQIVKTLPLTVMLTVLFAAVSFTPEFGSFEPVSMLMDLFNIALNFALGWTIVGTNSINTLVQVYINRTKVLSAYRKTVENKTES